MRLLRGNVPVVLERFGYRFELGRAKLLVDGGDALVISSGLMTMRALEAVEKLKATGLSIAVLHVSTIKPLDTATILAEAAKSGRPIIVAENHSVAGGLGEAIGALLMRNRIANPFHQIGLPDQFLDAGALPTLHDRYGISTEAVVSALGTWCRR